MKRLAFALVALALAACTDAAPTERPVPSAIPDAALRAPASATSASTLRCPAGECPFLMPGSEPPAYQCGPCDDPGGTDK